MVLARDPVCTICHREASTHADHVIPKVAGGEDSLENVRGTCATCNARKSLQDIKMKPKKA
jgi:5-methylcytosine-specific restriction endonuclease McrA